MPELNNLVRDDDGAVVKMGKHVDPADPAVALEPFESWRPRRRNAWNSPNMERFRDALRPPGGGSTRDGILEDLGVYHEMAPQECVERAINWEAWSVAEWHAKPRDSSESLTDFYNEVKSWAFDLCWYAYQQAEGIGYPVSVTIADDVPWPGAGRRHLDYGSGIGATAQLMTRLGFESDLADLSTTLLDFARWRLERRGEQAGYVNLNDAVPAAGRYDVITAIDVLAHVPDVAATARGLHAALKPGGLLYANFEVRPDTPENAWHLYSDERPLLFELRRAGFEPEASWDGMTTRYRRVETTGAAHRARLVRDMLTLRNPAYVRARHAAGRVKRRLRG